MLLIIKRRYKIQCSVEEDAKLVMKKLEDLRETNFEVDGFNPNIPERFGIKRDIRVTFITGTITEENLNELISFIKEQCKGIVSVTY